MKLCPTCNRRLPKPKTPKPEREPFARFWREVGVCFAFASPQWPGEITFSPRHHVEECTGPARNRCDCPLMDTTMIPGVMTTGVVSECFNGRQEAAAL